MLLRRPFISLLLALALVATGWSIPTAAQAAEPSISGTVTASDGGSVEDTSVTFYRWDEDFEFWDWWDGASVDPDTGAYSLDLPAGKYKVAFENWDRLAPEYYDDAEDIESATEVIVGASAVTGIDAELAVNAAGSSSLSGTVTASDAGAVVGVTVEVWADAGGGDWGYVDATSVDPDSGDYSLDLDPGTYRVHFSSEDRLVSEYYDDESTLASANDVVVDADGIEGIDAVLAAKAAISGTVSATDGGSVAGVRVEALAWNDDWGGWRGAGDTEVQASGAYALPVEPGRYKVRFIGSDRLIGEYYDNSPSQSAAATIDVGAAGRSGINAELAVGGIITGTVTVPPGADRSGLSVEVTTPDGDWAGWGQVNGDTGQYTVSGLEGGGYFVQFAGNGAVTGEYYDNVQSRSAATTVSVAAGATRSGINAALESPGRITGTVTVPSGVDRSDITVSVLVPGNDGEEVGSAFVESDGTYAVGDIPAGSYLVRFSSWRGNVADQYYSGKYLRSAATRVTVASAATTSGINATLVAGTTISGRVSLEEDDDDAGGVDLTLYARAAVGSPWERFDQEWADSDGTFTFPHVPNGEYIVEAEGREEHAGEFWNGVGGAGADTAAGAKPISVTGTPTTGIDLRLDLGATITGTVKDTAGAGTGGQATAYRLGATGTWDEVASGSIARDNGRYWLAGLRSGTYRVGFRPRDDELQPEFYNDKPTVQAAVNVAVGRQAEVTGINAVLTKNAAKGIITGKVTAPADTLDEVYVTAMPEASTDSDDAWYGTFNAVTGVYRITGLPAGRYVVRFAHGGDRLQPEYYEEVLTREAATPVTVTAGGTTANINATLAYKAAQSRITGTVTSPSGPVALAEVSLYTLDEGEWFEERTVRTGANGVYTFSGLMPKAYRVGFVAEGYVSEFYDNKSTVAAANTVSPTSGQTVANVNAVLAKDATLGSIRGTLTAPSGPVSGAWVTVYRQNGAGWTAVRDALSAANGTYLLNGLQPGTYRVGFRADGMIDEFYDNATSLAAATNVVLATAGSATANAALACSLAGCPVKPGTPTISGTAAVGQTLTVKPGTWSPTGVALEYRWFRATIDGQRAIVGATGTTYKVRPADVGAPLQVRVKGSKTGWLTRPAWSRVTSVAVESLPKPPPPKPVAAALSVSAKGAKKSATFTITVRASGRTPTGTVTIKLGAKRLKTVSLRGGRAKVKVTKQKKGKRTYTIVYSGGGGVLGKTVKKTVKIK